MPNGSSLILSWENPTDLWNPAGHRCEVWRTLGVMKCVRVADDVTWGFYCDTENGDPAALYHVIYLDSNGAHVAYLPNADIERYAKPETICEISIARTTQIGRPDAGRKIEISDEAGGSGDWRKSIVTNSQGKAVFYAMPNARLLARIDGEMQALDFIVPNVRTATFEQLAAYGSFVDADPRRSIGWNP